MTVAGRMSDGFFLSTTSKAIPFVNLRGWRAWKALLGTGSARLARKYKSHWKRPLKSTKKAQF